MKSQYTFIAMAFIFYLQAQMGNENFKNYNTTEIKQIEKQYSFQNLRLYPIKAKKEYHKAYEDIKDFINIETALKNNQLKIEEVSQSGTVNSLILTNSSNKEIYGLAGEVVIGGKQDRILGEDVKLKPNETKKVSAYCVEHGRWQPKENGTAFKEYYNVTNNKVRKAAVVNKNQQEVWSNVAEVVSKNDSQTSTGTYAALKNNENYQQELQAYYKKFKDSWFNDPEVVGVVAVSGDQIIGCDIFATHQLFQNSFNNLLYAYISQAITEGARVEIEYAQVQEYLQGFLDDYNPNANLTSKGKAFEFENQTYHLSAF